MAELSRENLDQGQVNDDEKENDEILKILNEFIIKGKYRIKLPPKYSRKLVSNKKFPFNITLNNLFKYYSLIVIIFFFLMLLIIYYFQKGSVVEMIAVSLLYFSLIPLGILFVLMGLKIIISLVEETNNAEKNSIFRVFHYNMENYFQIIELLGNKFDVKNLGKAEIRFKAIINQSKNDNKLSSKLIPAFSMFIVAILIYFWGSPNFNKITNEIFKYFSSISGMIAIVAIVWNIFHELLSQDLLIYEQCILILQEAQNIAKDLETKKNLQLIKT